MTTWVLLRGLAREARHWGRFPALLQAALPAGDAVVCLDLPGNGRRCHEASPREVMQMVEAARRELAMRPQRGSCVLLALSLGAMVALQWAALERRRIAGCVLVNTSLAGFSPPWQRPRAGSWPALARILLARDPLAREQGVLRLTSNRPATPALAQEWAALARECGTSRSNVLRQLAAAARFRAGALRPEQPTLLLASECDRLVAPACSRAIAQAWGLPLRLHPWAGHDLPLDDPGWVVEQAVAWWGQQSV